MYSTDDDPEAVRERAMRRIATEGLEAAVEAGLGLLRDPKAPAAARATVIGLFMRLSGLTPGGADDGAVDKPASEMSLEELDASIARLERLAAAEQAAEPGVCSIEGRRHHTVRPPG